MGTSRGIVSLSGRTWIDGEVTPNSAPAKEVCRAAAAAAAAGRRGGCGLIVVIVRCLALLFWIVGFLAGDVSASTSEEPSSQNPQVLGSYRDSTYLNYVDGIAYDVSLLAAHCLLQLNPLCVTSRTAARLNDDALCLLRQESRGYAFVASYWADSVSVVDLRTDVTNPSRVGYYSSSTYLNGARGIAYDVSDAVMSL